jgi:gluconate 2-dehydrogenase gamma chain
MSTEEIVRAYLANGISRREFMKRLQAAGVTAGAAFGFAELLAGCRSRSDTTGELPMALSASAFATLEAITGRLLPTTDTPGAIEAGAAFYIDIALAGPYRPQLARYQAGLAALDAHCTTRLGKPFAALGPEQQDTVLESLETGKVSTIDAGEQFFEMLWRHTMEGVFCEPTYGGNRDLVGWKLVGFPGQRHGYDDPYIDRVIDLAPVATARPPLEGA